MVWIVTGIAAGLFVLIMGWGSWRRIFLNSVIRLLVGILLIYGINYLLHRQSVGLEVQINEISAPVCAVLGTPGVVALYLMQAMSQGLLPWI